MFNIKEEMRRHKEIVDNNDYKKIFAKKVEFSYQNPFWDILINGPHRIPYRKEPEFFPKNVETKTLVIYDPRMQDITSLLYKR